MIELQKIILSLSLSGALLILALLLCKPVVKDKLSKKWQYYIWLIVIARLLLPFTSQLNLMGTLFKHIDSTVIQTYENLYSQQYNPELPQTDFVDHDIQVGTTDGESLKSDNLLQNMLNMAVENIGAICLLVWLIVAVGLLIRKVTIYQSFVKYIKAGRLEISDLALWEQVGKLVEQTGVKGSVGLYTNSLISSPLLVGFFHPCIMLPTTQLSDSDFQYTILHELTHYKRWDMFYKWLVQFTVCLHWFNPLVYFMNQEVSRACELACDEAIIGKLDADGRQAYGETLLNAVRTGGSYKDSLASVTLSESKDRLKERLDTIMSFKKKTKMATAISITLVMVLCFSATSAGAYTITPQASQNEKVSAPSMIKNTALQSPELSGEKAASESSIISLSSDGRGSITESGSFNSEKNQYLILTIQSDIQGGSVDLFLFSPDKKEQRFTFDGSNKIESISVSAGKWSYNCTGFFRSGEISILGEFENEAAPRLPDLSGEKATVDSSVISLSSNGQGSITQSGSFKSMSYSHHSV